MLRVREALSAVLVVATFYFQFYDCNEGFKEVLQRIFGDILKLVVESLNF